MTNKLPVVGKRYKSKKGSNGIMEIVYNNGKEVAYQWPDLSLETFNIRDGIYGILLDFEELPDQEPTTEKSSTVNKVQEALEELKEVVKNTNKELRLAFNNAIKPHDLLNKATNLINALEESTPLGHCIYCGEELDEFTKEGCCTYDCLSRLREKHALAELDQKESLVYSNIQETPVTSIVEPTSKSIWKPISELPDYIATILVRYRSKIILGDYTKGKLKTINGEEINIKGLEAVKEWCYLTDFINHQESLEKRIERLERGNK